MQNVDLEQNKNEAIRVLNTRIEKAWLDTKELQSEYGFSISTQAKYRMNRKIPFSKIGKYIRYSRAEINEWLKNNHVEVA